MEETDLEIEEEREYTPEELGIDYEMTYFDKNKEEIYYESEAENEVQWIVFKNIILLFSNHGHITTRLRHLLFYQSRAMLCQNAERILRRQNMQEYLCTS